MTYALIFPGQGSQTVGMGKDLQENFKVAREVLEEAEDALQFRLSKLMFEGPMDELTQTLNAQPALLTVSMMALRVLETELGAPLHKFAKALAGHSLGEYSALCAGGALSLSEAVKLVRFRGIAMQNATQAGIGSMAAVLGLEMPLIEEICQELSTTSHVCGVANDNCPGQVVISGHIQAIEKALELAKEKGAKRAIMLPVSAAFHSPLMQPAAVVLEEYLSEVSFHKPTVEAIVMNVTARPLEDLDMVKRLLVEQLCGRVRWTESVKTLCDLGITHFIECGAGKVLSGLVKRIACESSTIVSLQDSKELEVILGQFAH